MRHRAWASNPPVEPRPLEERALERELTCPRCHTRLATHPYYGPGNVVVDSCGRCDVIWLDFGELRQILDAPGSDRGGRDRGDDDQIPERSERGQDLVDAVDPLDVLFDLLT